MMYQYNKDLNQIESVAAADLVEKGEPILGYISLKELMEVYETFDIDYAVIESCTEVVNRRSALHQNVMNAWEDYTFGVISILDIGNLFGKRDTVGLYFAPNLFLCIDLIDQDGSTKKAFEKTMQQPGIKKGGVARFFTVFVRELIRDNVYLYDTISSHLEALDGQVRRMESDDKGLENEISRYNHELLAIFGYYEQLAEVCRELEENDNEIFSPEDLGNISSLSNRIERYGNNINLLREYCNQIRASYLAQLDIYLNQIMKIFTVITTLFLPLTLIVGWYGMNFKFMPELNSRFGYIGVIILSVLVVIGCMIFFKKKKLL